MSRLRELYAQKAAPAWSCLVETLNDPNLIAVVLFCLIGLVVIAGRLRWNEWYVATHLDGVESSEQVGSAIMQQVKDRRHRHAGDSDADHGDSKNHPDRDE